MKKEVFYTAIQKDGVKTAVKVNGYNDGTFLYYKNEWGRWNAIDRATGLAIASIIPTRKEAVKKAHDNINRLLDYQKTEAYKRWVKEFNFCIMEALKHEQL